MGKLKSRYIHFVKNKWRKQAAFNDRILTDSNHDTPRANNDSTHYDDDPIDMPDVDAPASNDIDDRSLGGPQIGPASSITSMDYMNTNRCKGFNSAGNFIPNELMGKWCFNISKLNLRTQSLIP